MTNPVNLVHRVKKKEPATFECVGLMFPNRAEIPPGDYKKDSSHLYFSPASAPQLVLDGGSNTRTGREGEWKENRKAMEKGERFPIPF
jgi:hypothetical protein